MTLRQEIASIVSRRSDDVSAEYIGWTIIDCFSQFDPSGARYGMCVQKDLIGIVRQVGRGLTPDQVARLVIRRLHDRGLLDVRDGWLDDDPDMLEDLAETCDIPA